MRGSSNLCFSHVYFGLDVWFPLTSNVVDRSLNLKYTWVVWAPCSVGPVAGDTQCWPSACPTDGISIGFGFRSGLGCFGFECAQPIVGRFAHSANVTLSLCVRNFVVIDGVRFEPERGRFWSSFGFERGIVGGTGTRAVKSAHVNHLDQIIFAFFCFCFESLLFACCIMSCHDGNKLY